MIVKLYRMKRIDINIPIYDQEVILLKADNLSTIDDYVEDCYRVQLDKGSNRSASTYILSNDVIIIGITPDVTDRVIVHETGHAVFQLLKNIGINPYYDDESFCYIQDFLFDKVTKWNKND